MFTRTLLATTLLASGIGLTAGEAGPLIDLSLCDGAKLIEHWNASIYGKLWNDQALAHPRSKLMDKLAEIEAGIGFAPTDALAKLTAGGLRVLPGAGADAAKPGALKPIVLMQGDLGDFAAKLTQVIMTANNNPPSVKIPGAAEAFAIPGQQTTIARFANVFQVAVEGGLTDLKPWQPAATGEADVVVRFDGARWTDLLNQQAKQQTAGQPAAAQVSFAEMMAFARAHSGMMDLRLSLTAEGMREHIVSSVPPLGTLPADRALLARLPAETLLVLAVGIDGGGAWKELRGPLMSMLAMPLGAADAAAAEKAIDQRLQNQGLNLTLSALIEGAKGTALLAVTPGTPFPAVTLAMPRSPAFDQVFGLLAQMLQVAAPTDGNAIALPIPNLPVAVQLAVDRTHWLISSDAALPQTWLAGTPGGFADAPAGKAALANAPAQSHVIGASNTPAVLRTLAGFLSLALNANPNLDGKDKQAIMQGIARAAATASTGWLAMSTDGQRTVIDDRGLIGMGPLMAFGVIAGLTASSRQDAAQSEPLAAATLRVGIAAGQQQFKAGGYLDQDGDGAGEYGFLGELGGLRPTPTAKAGLLQLVDPQLAAGGPENGYRFAVFLPDGAGGALAEPAGIQQRALNAGAAKAQAKRYVAYAWPDEAGPGKRMLAITEAGQVFAAPFDGTPPAWNALFGGGTWEAAPTWKPWGQRGGRRGDRGEPPPPAATGAGPGEF